jgi:hypothetical protein
MRILPLKEIYLLQPNLQAKLPAGEIPISAAKY